MPASDQEGKWPGSSFNIALLLLIVSVTVVRLSLIGTGTMAFIDERRYIVAMLGLRSLGEGHVLDFLRAINSLGARPGDGLWRSIPGLGQAVLLLAFKLNPNSPPSLQVPQAFNVLIMSLNLLLLYWIYRRFFSLGLALLSVALYASLVNTNVYVRHLLPYDHALFFFLLALWLLLKQIAKPNSRRSWWIGAISGFSYAVYPGYFMGPVLLLILSLIAFLTSSSPAGKLPRATLILPLVSQLAGIVTVLGLFELLAKASDTSYVSSSRYIATTVTQGSFAEGISFISTYFWQVEGWLGVGLLGLCALGLLMYLVKGQQLAVEEVWLARLLYTGFLAWAAYAGLVLAHKLVFYGRILHFFVPFVVLGAMVALREAAIRWPKLQQILLASGWSLAFWHFGAFALGYRSVLYPGDVAYAYGIQDTRQISSISTTGCDASVIFYRVFGPRLREQPTAAYPRYELVNFAYLYPLSCYQPHDAKGREVIVSVPYFMKYSAYQFEGHNPAERALLREHPYDFLVIAAE